MKTMPAIIKKVGFDFRWDIKKVWILDYPVKEINISELEWHFEIPFLSTENGYYDLKPLDIIIKIRASATPQPQGWGMSWHLL